MRAHTITYAFVFLLKFVFSNSNHIGSSSEEEAHKEVSTRSSSYQPNTKIYVCGDRIREVIRYVCPGRSNQGYYTPGVNQNQDHATEPHLHHHHKRRYETTGSRREFLPKRLRRQIVRECCNQPCFEKNLLKYCNAFVNDEVTSTETPNIESVTEQRREPLILLVGSGFSGGFRYQNAKKFGLLEQEIKGCSCKKRHRKKLAQRAKSNQGFIPMVYIPYELGVASLRTNRLLPPDWLWGRSMRSISQEKHTGSMQVITEAPHPEPFVIHADDINFYSQ